MTLFKDIKPNYSIHILIKSDDGTLEYTRGKVVNVTPPYYPPQGPGSQYPPHLNMGGAIVGVNSQPSYNRVMDITIQIGERNRTYTVSENSSMAEAPGGVVLATNSDLIVGEVSTIRARAKEDLDKMTVREKEISCSDSILEQIQPEIAEKRGFDKRLKNLEAGYNSIQGDLKNILDILKKDGR